MKQRDKKIALIVAAVVVLVLLMAWGASRKNTEAVNSDSPIVTSEAGETAQEDLEANNQGESHNTENSQPVETGASGSTTQNDNSNGNGTLPAGSHQTTNADGTTETVLPAEPLKPTKVEKPGKKPTESQGESQMGSQGGNQSQIVDGDKPKAQSGTPTEKPGQNPSSQTGATTPTDSGGTGSDNPSQGEAGDSNGGGVELPIILFD